MGDASGGKDVYYYFLSHQNYYDLSFSPLASVHVCSTHDGSPQVIHVQTMHQLQIMVSSFILTPTLVLSPMITNNTGTEKKDHTPSVEHSLSMSKGAFLYPSPCRTTVLFYCKKHLNIQLYRVPFTLQPRRKWGSHQ